MLHPLCPEDHIKQIVDKHSHRLSTLRATTSTGDFPHARLVALPSEFDVSVGDGLQPHLLEHFLALQLAQTILSEADVAPSEDMDDGTLT